jgi:hypothetical protein
MTGRRHGVRIATTNCHWKGRKHILFIWYMRALAAGNMKFLPWLWHTDNRFHTHTHANKTIAYPFWLLRFSSTESHNQFLRCSLQSSTMTSRATVRTTFTASVVLVVSDVRVWPSTSVSVTIQHICVLQRNISNQLFSVAFRAVSTKGVAVNYFLLLFFCCFSRCFNEGRGRQLRKFVQYNTIRCFLLLPFSFSICKRLTTTLT